MTQNQSPLPKVLKGEYEKIEEIKEVKEVKSQSPLPQVVKVPVRETQVIEELFDFPTAIKKIIEGKKVSKKEWNSNDEYGILHKARLTLHKKEGTNHDWILSEGDLEGKDWFVVN